jgi:hypothetical protein
VEELLPETKTARVPVLLSIMGKAFCEFEPERWVEKNITPIENLPLPPGYSIHGAEREGIFAVSIGSDRLSPIFRTGMKVYLKPVEQVKDGLYLCRDGNNLCYFVDILSSNDGTTYRDLITGEAVTEKPVSFYRVITILV